MIINSTRSYIQRDDSFKHEKQLPDTDLLLFAKILKNEIDEGFYYVQMHIIDTIKQILL